MKDYVGVAESVETIPQRLTGAGLPVEGIEPVGDDVVLDVEVTSNRGDCLGHIGMARELGAYFARPLKMPAVELAETGTLEIEEQGNIKDRLQAMVLPLATVTIDGDKANPVVDRVDFLTVGTQGVLPRPEPVSEVVAEAFVGVTVVYLTPRTPEAVILRWESFDGVMLEVPATVSDPEFSQIRVLSMSKKAPTRLGRVAGSSSVIAAESRTCSDASRR